MTDPRLRADVEVRRAKFVVWKGRSSFGLELWRAGGVLPLLGGGGLLVASGNGVNWANANSIE